MSSNSRIPFHVQTLIAMALGAALGAQWGPGLAPLGTLGGALIQIIKALATPLLFLVLLDSFVHANIRGRSLGLLIGICAINAFFAVLIGMGLSHWLQPGAGLSHDLPEGAKPLASLGNQDLWSTVLGYIPESIFQPFLTHNVPGVIILAVLFGLGLNALKRDGRDISGAVRAIETAAGMVMGAIGWVVKFSPIAVFVVTAQAVGTRGFAPLMGLAAYVGCSLLGMACQVIFVYQVWIKFFAKIPLRIFWKQAREPVAYSFGVNSSLATLPLTLQALDRLKISPTAARIGAGLGTNFNNDGILLYEAMAVLIVAQAYGVQLSFAAQMGLAFSCVITTFGVAGVPEAGIVALSLVLASAGLPTEILPLLLTVDWIVARCRSATNVVGDLTVSIALDRFRIG